MVSRIEIRALVLDFDGLVLDTESCVYEAWRRTYEGFGCELPLDRWCGAIGSDLRNFDPLEELNQNIAAPGVHLADIIEVPVSGHL